MNHNFRIPCLVMLLALLFGCTKKDKDYQDFTKGGEIVYPGVLSNTDFRPGNLRTKLQWSPSPDPNIKNYLIFWNNGQDSMAVPATSHNPADTLTVVISGLKEYVYSFTLYSVYEKGNRSVPRAINNVRVYGPVYQGGLLNRGYNANNPYQVNADGTVSLHFNKPDTINISTDIRYTDTLGVVRDTLLLPGNNTLVLKDYKSATTVKYQSSYIPVQGSIDTFKVSKFDDFPKIIRTVLCTKSLFQPLLLANDITDAYGWVMQNLWDGSTGEPGFHTPGQTFPQFFTFDMGVQSQLQYFRLWQRSSGLYNYGNPKRFEVWGSQNAPDPSGDWAGWTLLTTFTSVKPSGSPVGTNTQADIDFAAAGEPFIFPETIPQVRYLRFKILETWGATNYFHICELSFYKIDQ